MSEFSIVLGWSAPPMREQYPILDQSEANQFDLDSKAISRLSVSGLITRAQRDAAARKLTQLVYRAVQQATRRAAA